MLVLVMHEAGQFRVRRECAMDVVPVIAVAAVSCSVMNSDEISILLQPGYECSKQTIKIFGAEVVEDLTGDNQVIATFGKIVRQNRLLDVDVAKLGNNVARLSDGTGGAVHGENTIASRSQQTRELTDGAAEFEAVVIPLPGQ
jgi:hypothetical protein